MRAADSRPTRSEPRVFERLAEDYRSRPGYPEALVDRLSELAGAGRAVVDLGAGTGALAAPLARRGHRVWAVEPAAAMLEVCRETCQELEVVHVLGTAERTHLESGCAGLVLLADAVHWVPPDAAGAEAARLLVPDGVAAVVIAEPMDTPFMRDVQEALRRANPRARPRSADPRARQWLALAGGPGRPIEEQWKHEVPLTPELLAAVVRSLSYAAPALGPQETDRLVNEVRAQASARGGAVWSRQLRLWWLRRGRR
jgi:ubiquinone/menaquinone biosynthesis C-methylase UbiE